MRIHRGTVTVDAKVDIDDILRNLDDAYLREECVSRGILTAPPHDLVAHDRREDFIDLADRLRDALRRQDGADLEILILQLQMFAGVPRLTIPKPTKAALFVGLGD